MINLLFKHKTERSDVSHAILEANSRKRKAAKIKAILETQVKIGKSAILDIGTGSGHIANTLGEKARTAYSVDIIDERKVKKNYKFKLVTDEKLPFEDSSFDIVISNHVIEHTPDQNTHIKEILRVLKPGGYVYLATPNKFWITDPHYKLPFISWMPRKVSSKYLKVIQKKDWDIFPLSAWDVKRKFGKLQIENALPILLTTKAGEKLDTWRFILVIAKSLPKSLLRVTQYISPTLIYLIRKDNRVS